MYCGPYSAGVLHSVSDQNQNLQNCSPPLTKITSKDNIQGLVSLKFLRPCSFRKLGTIFYNRTNKSKLSSKYSLENPLCSKAFKNVSPKIFLTCSIPNHPTEESFLCHIHLREGSQNFCRCVDLMSYFKGGANN
jgi:hypothetical protein